MNAATAGAQMRRVILVTGFGPFPGCAQNPTASLIHELGVTPPVLPHDMALETAVLPTEWDRAWESLAPLLSRVQPVAVIAFGVSPRADGFCLERFAYNETCRLADAAGKLSQAGTVCDTGLMRIATGLPVDDLIAALRANGLRADGSTDPGRYLCNFILYRLLDWAGACGRPVHAGFVHVPHPDDEDAGSDRTSVAGLSRNDLLAGAHIIIAHVARTIAGEDMPARAVASAASSRGDAP